MFEKRGKKKDKFEALDSDFKDSVEGASDEDLRRRIAEWTLSERENQKNKKQDKHLAEVKLKVEKLSSPYKDKSQINTLKVKLASSTSSNESELKDFVAPIAIEEIENQFDKESDQSLKSAITEYKEAAATYSEASKMNKLRIQYLYDVLRARGRA